VTVVVLISKAMPLVMGRRWGRTQRCPSSSMCRYAKRSLHRRSRLHKHQ